MIAVLVENTGNPEGPSGEKAGLYSAAPGRLAGADHLAADGHPGGTTLQDPVRGVMNADRAVTAPTTAGTCPATRTRTGSR